MKKIYFIETNGYDCLATDDGEVRRIYDMNGSDYDATRDENGRNLDMIKAFLESVEDDSSWEQFEETMDELFGEGCKIWAEMETNC